MKAPSYRYVTEKEAGAAVRRAGGSAEAFRSWLAKQPRLPELVGRKEAARILSVQSPHITRFIRQGRMPDPVEVEGAPNVYLKVEVEAFAERLKESAATAEQDRAIRDAERAVRAKRREEKERAAEAERVAEERKERKREKDREYAARKRAEKKKEKN